MSGLHVVKTRDKRKILKPIDSQHLLISMLLPPVVRAFFTEPEKEVETLSGARHGCTGSIVLGNQRVSIKKPRLRDETGEVELTTYTRFQDPGRFDSQVFE